MSWIQSTTEAALFDGFHWLAGHDLTHDFIEHVNQETASMDGSIGVVNGGILRGSDDNTSYRLTAAEPNS